MDADFWMSIALLVFMVLFIMPEIIILILLIPFLPFILVLDIVIRRKALKKRG